jgi:multidrug efflux pump subunit AcrA (membrane-fusion protein)
MKLLVEKVDKIFWVSVTFEEENDPYEYLLSAKNTVFKTQTIDNIKNSYEFINKYKTEFSKINWNLSDNEINTIIQNFYNDSQILITLFDTSLDAIDMSIDSIDVLPVSKLEWFSSTLNVSRSSLISIRSQLQSLSSSINSLLSWELQENKLQVSLEQKQLDYNINETALKKQKENISIKIKELENLEKDNLNQINRKNSQILIYSEKISVLKKELKDILDWPDFYDIKQQQNLINQAELRLERTRDQKDNYQIIAEFDGRIRTIDIAEWEQYKLDDRKYIVIENPNLIELELQVSQIDIVKIKEWDPVVITFDAFPNNPINAKISNRNVNPEINTRGWIYYKANVILEKQQLEILAGMSALVVIIINQANNVLLIPTLALVQEWGKQYVYIKDLEEYKLHEIKTGIVNNFQAEVIEWLIEGNVIKASVLDEETLKSMWIEEWGDSLFGN